MRTLKREYSNSDYIFITERKTPITDSTFRKIVVRAGMEANLGIPVYQCMLRHFTEFKLPNDGQDTRSIQ
ncbi:tyrosine-type recombinase/integrase [Clostridium gelidum]|uniref:tyrosine-type recombinase/integrase n=1 Tax=Clostridium gelidum TaxID=704125 RepID=UPI001CC445A3